MELPDNRRMRGHLPNDLSVIVVFVILVFFWFVNLIPKSHKRLWTHYLQRNATEHSSTCHCIRLYTISWMYTSTDCRWNGITKKKKVWNVKFCAGVNQSAGFRNWPRTSPENQFSERNLHTKGAKAHHQTLRRSTTILGGGFYDFITVTLA
jgi:hypothetical protein